MNNLLLLAFSFETAAELVFMKPISATGEKHESYDLAQSELRDIPQDPGDIGRNTRR
jgi:hypothetical protein